MKINHYAHVFLLLALALGLTSSPLWAAEDGQGTNVVRNLRVTPNGTLSLGDTAITNWTLLPVSTSTVSLADYLATNAVFAGATNTLNTATNTLQIEAKALQDATNVLNSATNALNTATNTLNTHVVSLIGWTNAVIGATNVLNSATNALNTAVGNLNANTTRWDNAVVIREGTTGEAIAYSNLCYYNSSDSKWWKANATNSTTASGFLGLALGTAGAGPIPSPGLLLNGCCTNLWGFAAGSIIYMDTNSGALATSKPKGTNNIVRIVGYAISTTNIYFNPDRTFIEILGGE